jgi:thiol-disulfide isomerase/thioredoxin
VINIDDIDSKQFESLLDGPSARGDSKWTLIDLWAVWCGPCRALHTTLTRFADGEMNDLRIVRLDLDAAGDVADRYGIRTIPTLILARHGREVARHVEALGLQERDGWLRTNGVALPRLTTEQTSSYDASDARSLGAFYADEELKRFLLDRALAMADAGQIQLSRFPFYVHTSHSMTATISTALVKGGSSDLFTRLTGMPLGIAALLHSCGPTTRDQILALAGGILPGSDLRALPRRFMIKWLSDEYCAWADVLGDSDADTLRQDWLSVARATESGSVSDEGWSALADRIDTLRSADPNRVIARHFAGLLAPSAPIDPDSREWCNALCLYGIYLQHVEAERRSGMTTEEINWETFGDRRREEIQASADLSIEETNARFMEEYGEEDRRINGLKSKARLHVGVVRERWMEMLAQLFREAT